jgi:predicted TPR repeat methyltransferase
MESKKLDEARRLFYLGLESQEHGQLEEAENLYRQSLSFAPDRPSILTNLYVVLIQQNKLDAAIPYLDRVLELSPEDGIAWLNKAVWLTGKERLEEALACCDKAIAIKPGYAAALHRRGDVLHALKRNDEARASYQAALESGGDAQTLRFYLAALGADVVSAVPPPDLVVDLFDKYAERFDRHLASLEYRAPQMLFDAVSAAAPAEGWDIADLGCGTGLCGPLFRPIARTLTGVDLSPNMIGKAQERKIYDRLVEGEITEFVRAHAESFDLVIAADVLVYIGDVGPLFEGVRKALRRGGRFAFSVEIHEGQGFVLRPSRRYAQSLSYLRERAAACGFVETGTTGFMLRKEYGQEIDGAIVVLKLQDG